MGVPVSLDALIKQVSIAHMTLTALMDQAARFSAAATAWIDIRICLQTQKYLRFSERNALSKTKPCPITGDIDSIAHEGGGLVRWECES